MKTELISSGKRVAFSNFVLFLLGLVIVQFDRWLFKVNWGFDFYIVLACVILGVDLLFTYHFIRVLYNYFSIQTGKLFKVYIPLSLITRILAVISIYDTSDHIFSITSTSIAVTGIVYGLLLLQPSEVREFRHREKLRFIAFMNLLGIMIIFGSFFADVYVGLKLILPLPSALMYILVIFDIDQPLPQS